MYYFDPRLDFKSISEKYVAEAEQNCTSATDLNMWNLAGVDQIQESQRWHHFIDAICEVFHAGDTNLSHGLTNF